MANSTLSYFILSGYLTVGALGHLYVFVTALLYVVILLLNSFLIAVVCRTRTLHEPMYMFLCSLFLNQLYGSAGLFPFLLTQMLRDVHTVHVPFCFLQIFCQYTYVTIELCTLAAMSYDRYLAICVPLQYHTRMSSTRVLLFVALIWSYAFVRCMITLSLNLRLTWCGNVLDSVYCRNFLIMKLACSDSDVNNAYGLLSIVLSTLLPLLAILLSYVKILQVCFSGSRQMRRKAANTCTPHLASLLNFIFGCSFEIVVNRFDLSWLPDTCQVFFSLYYALLQPLFTPLIYGLQMQQIRSSCRQLLCNVSA